MKNKILQLSTLYKLIFINTLVFVGIHAFLLITGQSIALLNSSSFSLSATAIYPDFLYKPWTAITYMFVHFTFGHFLFNMFILYFASQLFTRSFDAKKLIPVYLLGGIVGFIFYLISFHFLPTLTVSNYMVGASASVMAVLVAAATYSPNTEVNLFGSFQVKFWIIAGLLLVYDFTSINRYVSTGGHIAHLGGALFGFLFASQFKKGVDYTQWFSQLFQKRSKLSILKSKKKGSYYQKPFVSDENFNLNKKANQKEVDRILDKISKSGYSSLTKMEKDYLFNQSKN